MTGCIISGVSGKAVAILLVIALLVVYYLARAVKSVRCTGRAIGIVTDKGYIPHSYYIDFRYTVDGKTYTGRTSISGLQMKRFEPGLTKIPVRYDVRKPEKYYVEDPSFL